MEKKRTTLKTLLPQIETDWLLPVWLLLAVLSAFVAEVWIIGQGVTTVYALAVGWPIGVTVASTQALGSMMYSNASTHNARRKLVYQRRRKGEALDAPRRENVQKSEPRLETRLPLTISVCAGVVSALVGLALYRADGGLGLLDAILAVASPAGSIMAALLNGVFASGELAVRVWREGQRVERPMSVQGKNERLVIVHESEPAEGLPKWASRWATKKEFLAEVSMNHDLVTGLTGADFARMTGKPGASARRWIRAAKVLIGDNGKQRAIGTVVVDDREEYT